MLSMKPRSAFARLQRVYHPIQVILHWAVVALIVGQYATSGSIRRTHEAAAMGLEPTGSDLLLHTVHNRVGMLVTGLMILRLALRWWFGRKQGSPDLGLRTPKIAHAAHFAFYALIIAQGLTGFIATYFWWPISAIHVVLFKAILVLIAAHSFMAVWHHFVRRDDVLARMVPSLKR